MGNPGLKKAAQSDSDQKSIVAAMMEPGFYPKRPAEVTHKETHISHLFFAGDLVYKIKKAVRFPFLDYSTLGKRRRFLYEELRLNRRLAPSVYLTIVPITATRTGWRLGGSGPVREYVLVMRRLPENRMLPALIQSGEATPGMMRELAELLAAFHKQAPPAPPGRTADYPAAVRGAWLANLADLEPFTGSVLGRDTWAGLKELGEVFVDRQRSLLERRHAGGWIRDVHGDLHCDHVCFAPEGIQVFDCIEFSRDLRRCDLASEIAFLVMDLEVRGAGALVEPFLSRYLELVEDRDMPRLLPFYKAYRALVRGKVGALRGAGDVAAPYFRFAARYAWDAVKPFLVVVCGLTGSGKSTLARELAQRLGMEVISSDRVRKTAAGVPGAHTVPYGEGLYSPEMTERTYAEMAAEAERRIEEGSGAILDATYIKRSHREEINRVAARHRTPVCFIRCFAPDESVQARLAERAAKGGDWSDGRWEIFLRQKEEAEPYAGEGENRLDLDTREPPDSLAERCERFIRDCLKKAAREPR
ncbi:MAG TPA: AAA family ATPase [candidate division Zixibacteria bacterium]|nr:AAA family ATPase [candidate division Zixibacteria bacterium]